MLVEGSRILRVRPSGIPEEMKQARRWVCWTAVPKTRKDGTVQLTKEPRRADQPARKTSSTDLSTWAEIDAAMAAVLESRVASTANRSPYMQRRYGASTHYPSRQTTSLSVASGAVVRRAL